MQVDFWTVVAGAVVATGAGVLIGVGSILWVGVRIYRLQASKGE